MSGLGRGLGSLIPNKKVIDQAISEEYKPLLVDDNKQVIELPVEKIDVNPHQPRQVFNHADLEDLINSIRDYGIIQPLIVTKQDNRYELIAGERRLRAAKILALKTVPCLIREADEQQKLELAIIENVQRANLNPIEEAIAYQRLMDQFNLNQEQVADRVGKSRSAIANTIRLLDLPEQVQKALVDKKITEGHARVIAGIDDENEQLTFLAKILEYNFTVRDAERESRKLQPVVKRSARAPFDPTLESLKERLRSSLATKVEIKKKSGKGQIIINFYSEEEFNDLVNKISD